MKYKTKEEILENFRTKILSNINLIFLSTFDLYCDRQLFMDFIEEIRKQDREAIIEMIKKYEGDLCYASGTIINKIKEL